MNLYIAEKPSLARVIANSLNKPQQNKDGYIQCADGDVVTWCVGHLLEQANPDVYDAKYKKWQMHDLPIIPSKWQLVEKKQTKKQLSVLRALVKKANNIIHCGDPDREGQLLVDQVIHHLPIKQSVLNNIQRCLISDLTPKAVTKALANLKPNQQFVSLSTCALARSRADWLFGINLSRAFTLQGQKNGSNTVLSIGRVQTPILGLVVQRDLDIQNHQSKTYYEVDAFVEIQNQKVKFKWIPSDNCQDFMDDEGRVLSKRLAQNVLSRIQNQSALITDNKVETKKLSAPLPYNLSALQIDCAKRFKYSAQKVLDHCQNLYEKHKLITYPRSDNRYLPDEHFQQRETLINSLIENFSASDTTLSEQFNKADLSKKPNCFNDKKVGAHHAIIPTLKKTNLNNLSEIEKNIYQLIARQYAMQFFEKFETRHQHIECEIQTQAHFRQQNEACPLPDSL